MQDVPVVSVQKVYLSWVPTIGVGCQVSRKADVESQMECKRELQLSKEGNNSEVVLTKG